MPQIKIKVLPYATPEAEVNTFLETVDIAPQGGINFRDMGICVVYAEKKSPGLERKDYIKNMTDEMALVQTAILGAKIDRTVAEKTIELLEKRLEDVNATLSSKTDYKSKQGGTKLKKKLDELLSSARLNLLMALETIEHKEIELNVHNEMIESLKDESYVLE